MDIREKIITRIKDSGLNQVELAKAAGISQSVLSRFLRGETSLRFQTLEKLWPVLMAEPPKQEADHVGK